MKIPFSRPVKVSFFVGNLVTFSNIVLHWNILLVLTFSPLTHIFYLIFSMVSFLWPQRSALKLSSYPNNDKKTAVVGRQVSLGPSSAKGMLLLDNVKVDHQFFSFCFRAFIFPPVCSLFINFLILLFYLFSRPMSDILSSTSITWIVQG